MKAKEKRIVGFLAVAALAAALSLLAGCAPAGKSVRDVIEDFIAAVNDRDASGVKDCLDEDAEWYNLAADITYWDTKFPNANVPFEITAFSKSGDSATVEFTGSGLVLDYYFEMTESKGSMFEPGTYYISRISKTDGTIIFK
jgi:hypothetical protein